LRLKNRADTSNLLYKSLARSITLPKYNSDSSDFIREDAQQQVNPEIARTSHPSISSRADPPQQQRVRANSRTTPSPSEATSWDITTSKPQQG
jgi:hypothetical protein